MNARILTLALLLVGGATPFGSAVLAVAPVHAETKELCGYAVDAGDWYCYATHEPGAACEVCLNISGHVSRLLTGRLFADGRWDVSWQRFAAESRVKLCRPVVKRMAALWP